MAVHLLTSTLSLPLPRPQVFAFFSDAANLGRITPPELDFTILTPLPIAMAAGTIIDYRLRLFGIPFAWQTLIRSWEPPLLFIDEQLQGPYHQWVHTHTFSELPEGGTLITDEVTYELPLAPFGEMAQPLLQRQLERIFAFRRQAVAALLLPSARR
jgi:ligand-binding SRPBCC domain-containing protein